LCWLMNRDTFSGFHPLVNFMYFAAVLGFTMFLMHPVSIAISLVCAAVYALYLSGRAALKIGLLYMLPMLIFAGAISPLFNHRGATILAYLPNGNPVTLESIAFGFASAVVLLTVITWFACFNAVITSDKIIYLFGRIIPALSLILAMALRLVPRFRTQIKVISDAQKCIGREVSLRQGIKNLSILISWALENAIETADSMKARGYGLPGRTAFSLFSFHKRDFYALTFIFACSAVIIAGVATEVYRFRFFPTIRGNFYGFWTVLVFASYFALAALPLFVNLKEDFIWKRIESKI